jgi:glyoxylase-like metal-dependent hydrolase (beta-lactamase superfamily II)
MNNNIIRIHVLRCGIVELDEALPIGDDTIILTSLPGHTQGNTGVIVRNNGKFVLITGDSAYQKESWNDLLIPGIVVNKNEALNSLKWIKKIANKENCIEILSSHDFRIKPHIIEL